MPYSLWLDGVQLGTTDLDVSAIPGRLAGVLQPTAQGLAVLPSITAFIPAMFDFHALCESHGIDAWLADEERGMATLAQFEDTPPVLRMRAALDRITRLQLRDARGATVPWSYILVTDIDELRARAGAQRPPSDEPPTAAPIRYLISATLGGELPPLARGKRPPVLVS